MAHEKKKKLLKKLMKTLRRRGETSPQGRDTMNPDPFHPEETAAPQGGTAVIRQVTARMMDEAAHKAAVLADGVAHHTMAIQAHPTLQAHATETSGSASPDAVPAASMADAGDPAEDDAHAPADIADGALRHSGDTVVSAAPDAAVPRIEETGTQGTGAPAATAPADAIGEYNAKLFEMARNNMAATGALFAALVQAKSVPEAVALNADHLRRQMETMTTQGRELATLAQKLALDAMQPFKGIIGR